MFKDVTNHGRIIRGSYQGWLGVLFTEEKRRGEGPQALVKPRCLPSKLQWVSTRVSTDGQTRDMVFLPLSTSTPFQSARCLSQREMAELEGLYSARWLDWLVPVTPVFAVGGMRIQQRCCD